MDDDTFNFWYAVNNTSVIRLPRNNLETFGTTVLNYHLISELMDSVNQVRVREGRIEASKPQILTPQGYGQEILEGFGEDAQDYLEWLQAHEKDLQIIQYGFQITKTEFNEHLITDSIENVTDRVAQDIDRSDDPLSAVVIGVEKPWEVCLLKMLRDVVRNSAPGNIQDFQNASLLPQAPISPQEDIEQSFAAASRNPALIDELHKKLKQYGLFEAYEDRFFAVVRANNNKGS